MHVHNVRKEKAAHDREGANVLDMRRRRQEGQNEERFRRGSGRFVLRRRLKTLPALLVMLKVSVLMGCGCQKPSEGLPRLQGLLFNFIPWRVGRVGGCALRRGRFLTFAACRGIHSFVKF